MLALRSSMAQFNRPQLELRRQAIRKGNSSMKKSLPLSALTLSAMVLVACGGSSSSSSTSSISPALINANYCRGVTGGGGGQTLKLSADPSGAPKYNTKCLIAGKPGKVTIAFSNPSAHPQDVAVKDLPGKVYGVSSKGVGRTKKGQETSLNLNLPAGRYVYYSTVPGDEAAGMLGTLLVK
jgi:hypothetical protein